MNETPKTQAFFSDIAQFVAESRALLERGAILELSGLDERVKRLCEEVLQLSQDERVQYAQEMQNLFRDLSLLGESLEEHRDKVATSLRGIGAHKKANSAYRTIELSDTKNNSGK